MRSSHGAEALSRVKVHTKFVPDLELLPRVDEDLCAAHRRSLAAAAADGAARPRAVPLVGLRGSRLRRNRARGSTSFSAKARSSCSAAPISTRRRRSACSPPAFRWRACRCSIRCSTSAGARASSTPVAAHGIQLLCYGSVAGGFLSERWLGQPSRRGLLENRSLTKYKLIIDDFGGWDAVPEAAAGAADDRRRGTASTSRRWPAAACSTGRRSRRSSSARAIAPHLAANLRDRLIYADR